MTKHTDELLFKIIKESKGRALSVRDHQVLMSYNTTIYFCANANLIDKTLSIRVSKNDPWVIVKCDYANLNDIRLSDLQAHATLLQVIDNEVIH